MKLSRPDLAAYGLAALCVAVVGVLAALGHPAPDLLQFVAVTALGAGAGVAVQSSSSGAAATEPPAPAPAPVPLAADPAATGVMRIATHSPS